MYHFYFQSPSALLKSKCLIEFIDTACVKQLPQIYVGLLPCLASVAVELVLNGDDPRPCFAEIEKIINLIQINQIDACNHVLVILCEVVTKCPSVYLEDLIRICKYLYNSL